jgi:hydrogenase-4 component F
MGILSLGIGVSGIATFGALLHMLGASLAKAMLFLAAGNILMGYGTKHTREVTGLMRALPATAGLFVAGLFAITGAPPFALFPSELALLTGMVRAHQIWIAVAMIVLQAIVFMAMGAAMLGMVLGTPNPPLAAQRAREDRWLVLPPLGLLLLTLVLGIHLPAELKRVLASAAGALGGSAP